MQYRIGEIIRNVHNSKPYLVVNIIYATLFVVDLEDKGCPTNIMAILPRSAKEYIKDVDVDCDTSFDYDEENNEEIVINSFKKTEQVTL